MDLDGDSDLDYIFTYQCGESGCFKIYLDKNGELNESLSEFGSITIEFENSVDFQPSKILIRSNFNHCCGESIFDSFRGFTFKNDSIIVAFNYVKFDYVNYSNEKQDWTTRLEPRKYLESTYFVLVDFDKYNVRFSADMRNHDVDFTCEEQSNIIAKIKKGSVLEVIGEYEGKDKDERKWLYVEISELDLIKDICYWPLTYDFKNQKFRAWISNKNVTIK